MRSYADRKRFPEIISAELGDIISYTVFNSKGAVMWVLKLPLKQRKRIFFTIKFFPWFSGIHEI